MELERLNAREIGLDATIDSLRQLLVESFRVSASPETIDPKEPLFSAGVGLSSIEGLELLAVIEKKYGVEINDVDCWVDESPTLSTVARFLIDNSPSSQTASR